MTTGELFDNTATPEPPKFNPWAEWCALYRKAYGVYPVSLGPDIGAAKQLAKQFKPEVVRVFLGYYLEDKEPWLLRQGHPLRLLSGRLNRYNSEKSNADPARKVPSEDELRQLLSEDE